MGGEGSLRVQHLSAASQPHHHENVRDEGFLGQGLFDSIG